MKKRLLLQLLSLSLVLCMGLSLAACGGEEPEITYTASFMADGELVEAVTFPQGATSLTEPEVPAKAGYTGVWATYELADEDIEIVAEYTAIEYTATFVANGEVVDTRTFTVETSYIIPPQVPGIDGYTAVWEDWALGVGNFTVEAVYTAIEYTVTFTDNADKNTVATVEAPITLPTDVEGVDYWTDSDGKIYAAGCKVYIGANETFAPYTGELSSSGHVVTNVGYTSSWKDSTIVKKGTQPWYVITSDSKDGGWNGAVYFRDSEPTFDAEKGTVTLTNESTSDNVLSLHKIHDFGVTTGAVLVSVKFYIDPQETFCGFFLRKGTSGNDNLFLVNNTPITVEGEPTNRYSVKWGAWGSTVTPLEATHGWNTIYMLMLEKDGDSFPVYLAIDNALTPVTVPTAFTAETLADWYSASFTHTSADFLAICNATSTAGGGLHMRVVNKDGTLTLGGISVMNVEEKNTYYVTFGEYLEYNQYQVDAGTTVTVPTVEGVTQWTDGTNTYEAGQEITLNANLTLAPVTAE